MTVIIWDRGRLLMAADTLSCEGGDLKRTVSKIHRVRSASGPCLVGYAGNLAHCRSLLAWIEAGADPKEYPRHPDVNTEGRALVVRWKRLKHDVMPEGYKPGTEFYYETKAYLYEGPHPFEVHDPYVVIGSGREVAIGALEMGATPSRAIAVASKHISSVGGEVEILRVEDQP